MLKWPMLKWPLKQQYNRSYIWRGTSLPGNVCSIKGFRRLFFLSAPKILPWHSSAAISALQFDSNATTDDTEAGESLNCSTLRKNPASSVISY